MDKHRFTGLLALWQVPLFRNGWADVRRPALTSKSASRTVFLFLEEDVLIECRLDLAKIQHGNAIKYP